MNKKPAHRRAPVWLGMLLVTSMTLLTACGGGSSAPAPSVGSATIAAAGGEVLGPDGVKLAIPPSALASATTFRIARDGNGAPELGGAKAISPVYAITPHGAAFAESARVSIPFNPADVAAGTQPILLKAEPGGNWTAIRSDVVGNTVTAADTPSLSFFAVGTCQTIRDTNIPGLDPLLYCPAAHQLKLTLQDGNGAELPTPTYPSGSLSPALSIESPTVLRYTVQWSRPAGVIRSDRINVVLSGAGLLPAQQPLRDFNTPNNFTQSFSTTIDPATVPNASAPGGVVIRIKASADYTTDAFYPGCFCLRPASWTFDTEIPVRVIYRGTQPVITQQPQNQSVLAGQPASFGVAANGNNLSVQWFVTRNGTTTPITGATGVSYTVPATAVSDSGSQYSARICSAVGTPVQQCINTNAATLTVTAAPVAPAFTTQPQAISVIDGQTGSLSVVATGQPAPSISWFQVVTPRGAPQTLEPVAGCVAAAPGRGTTTSATCNLGTLTLANDSQRYVAQASNGVGAAVNSSVVAVRVGTVAVAPAITSPAEPRDQTVGTGSTVTWTITASGTAPVSYRWRTVAPDGTTYGNNVCAGGVNPGQSTSATLTLTNVPAACDGYRFQAFVTNSVSPEASSRQAMLTVLPVPAAPQITTALAARSVLNNAQVTFNVVATGNPATFSYAWTLDGGPMPRVIAGCGTADPSCTYVAQLADSGKPVAVSVSNGVAPAASSSAVITVTTNDVAASITQQPAAQGAAVGGSVTFTIGTAGTPTPDVAWQTLDSSSNWVSNGVTGNTLTLNNLTLPQDGLQVRAIVSNTIAVPNGSQGFTLTSNAATLTVVPSVPSNALTATQIVAHNNKSLVVRSDGSVWAFGPYVDPVTGGFPNTNTPTRPVRVAGLPLAQQVAMGGTYNSWVLGRDGTVWGWGFINDVKGFAQGPVSNVVTFPSPVQVLMAASTPIDRVCQVSAWGAGALMVRSDTPGGTCAPNEPRSVWFTGGGGSATSQSGGSYATPLASLAGNGVGLGLPTGRWIVEVITSRDDLGQDVVIFARANDGTVYAWGGNSNGQLGTGDTTRRSVPTVVVGWQGATRIAVGGNVTLALMPDGSLKGAGTNFGGNLGIGTASSPNVLTPTVLAAPTGASDVSAAYNQPGAMALVGGELRYWGSARRFSNSDQFTPIPIPASVTPFTAVSMASYHALAIGPGGAVYAWGDVSALGCGNYVQNVCDYTQVPQLVTVP
jgi:hypothetical protein